MQILQPVHYTFRVRDLHKAICVDGSVLLSLVVGQFAWHTLKILKCLDRKLQNTYLSRRGRVLCFLNIIQSFSGFNETVRMIYEIWCSSNVLQSKYQTIVIEIFISPKTSNATSRGNWSYTRPLGPILIFLFLLLLLSSTLFPKKYKRRKCKSDDYILHLWICGIIDYP